MKRLRRHVIAAFLMFALVFPTPSRADIFGGDVAVLTQTLRIKSNKNPIVRVLLVYDSDKPRFSPRKRPRSRSSAPTKFDRSPTKDTDDGLRRLTFVSRREEKLLKPLVIGFRCFDFERRILRRKMAGGPVLAVSPCNPNKSNAARSKKKQ